MLRGMKWLIVFLIPGLFYCRFVSQTILAYTTIHYYAYTWMVIPYYHWYFYDFFILVPLFTLCGAIVWYRVLGRLISALLPAVDRPLLGLVRVISAVLTLLVCGWLIHVTSKIEMLPVYLKDPRKISYEKITAAIRPLLRRGDVILTAEIGILGYLLEDAVIRDINGIASPGVTLKTINNIDHFVERYRPRFIFFQFFMGQLEPRRIFRLSDGSQAVYRLLYPPGADLSARIDCLFVRE